MIGRSVAFRIANALTEKMLAFDAPVIEGENGTCKELAAARVCPCRHVVSQPHRNVDPAGRRCREQL
jgi:transcriptional regulator of aromatic amino acid metabolism